MAGKKPKAGSVDLFLGELQHPRMGEILELRKAILAARDGITEQVKWNAPSFGLKGGDRVTFRLQPKDRVELIFHRGAKVRKDKFTFADDTGLMEWLAPDRGVVAFQDVSDVKTKIPTLKRLVKAWIDSTTE